MSMAAALGLPLDESVFRITVFYTLTFFLILALCYLYTILRNYGGSNAAQDEETSVKIQSISLNEALERAKDDISPKCEDEKTDKKRRKKRGKKKANAEGSKETEEFVCLYPFTKSSSATQRRIKQQYDQLVKSHGSKGLTLDQIGQFVNCLVEARNELQSKSEVIKRRFTITKALLFKADRSSFDRLRQQIYKLELEQKRLEEDAFVYNWLQERLKVSPAYKKMLEIGACIEMKAKDDSLLESEDSDYSEISFEELLAQEKKDAFWQKNGKLKPCIG